MNLICVCCGKCWGAEHVFREKPEDFDRCGANIRACPDCHGTEPAGMTEDERRRLRLIAAMGEHLGEELERIAASGGNLDALRIRFNGDLSKLDRVIDRLAARVVEKFSPEGPKKTLQED